MKTLRYTLAAAIFASLAGVTDACAQTANASAQDLSIHINLLGLATLDVPPQIPSTITDATEPVAVDNQAAGYTNDGSLLGVDTGLLTSHAEYDTAPNIAAVGATVTVSNLDLSALNLVGDPLIALGADVITSTATVSGFCLPATAAHPKSLLDDYVFGSDFDYGNLHANPPGDNGGGGSGGTPPGDGASLGGLDLSLLGIDVPNLPLTPPPNTGIDLSALGIAGASLILNEQTITGDGVTSIAKSVNALHLTLNVAGLITADVVIGHSDASLSCP